MYRLFLLFFAIASDFNYGYAQSGSSCVTPNGEAAQCMSIYSCPVLYKAVTTKDPRTLEFLRASQCGYEQTPLVCCGSRASYGRMETNVELLPNRTVCGFQLYESKIINGETAGLDEYPWMALLRYRNSSGQEKYSCGGTLISNRYVITAAHCVVGQITHKIGKLVSVRLGEFNTDVKKDCIKSMGYEYCSDDPIDVEVEEAVANTDYNDRSRDRYHDIALLRLKRTINFTDFIRPVCLPLPSERAAIGERLTVVGWGRTESKRSSPTKQKLAIPVVDQRKCNGIFLRASVNLEDTQLCAGGETGKDSCTGDSGGPLLHRINYTSQHYIEGIVSFGAECGKAEWPGVYTRVSKYLDWIKDNMKP